MSEAIPHATYLEWIKDAHKAAGAVVDGLSGWEVGGVVVVAMAALGLVAKVGSVIPVWGPIISFLADKARSLFTTKAKAEAERRNVVAGDSIWQIAAAIDQIPADAPYLSDLKKKINELTPPEFSALFDEWKKSREAIDAARA